MTPTPIPAFTDNYIWAIIDEKSGFFDCVDPGEAQPVLDFATQHQLQLRAILLTHHHHDHIGGVAQLRQHAPTCQVFGPQDSRIPNVTQTVHQNETITVGSHSYKILFNPGHTATHISYYEQVEGWLFCGDTLFSAGCGRVFDGTLDELYQSLQLFKSLPPKTKIFCAHEYTIQNLKFAATVEPHNADIQNYWRKVESAACTLPSLLEDELKINPFLRTEFPAVQAYTTEHGSITNSSLEIFRVLREQKNIFK